MLTQPLCLWLSTQTWFCFLLVAPSKRPQSSQVVRQYGSSGVGRQYQLLGRRVARVDLLAINIYVPHRFVGAVVIRVGQPHPATPRRFKHIEKLTERIQKTVGLGGQTRLP